MYPRTDALREQGRGSDEDDALIETAERLAAGRRPLYVPTYLGNTPSVGPGWAALVSPLAITGTYPLLTPLAGYTEVAVPALVACVAAQDRQATPAHPLQDTPS